MNQNGSRPQLISLCGKSFIEDIHNNAFCIFKDCIIMYCEEFILLGSQKGEVLHHYHYPVKMVCEIVPNFMVDHGINAGDGLVPGDAMKMCW